MSIRSTSARTQRISFGALGLLAALLVALLGGCETTGNPRDGGLFGWSQQKADERQAALESERAAAERQRALESERGAALSDQRGRLSDEMQALQTRLSSALAENDALDAQLRALMAKGQLGNAELGRLQQTLAASQRARAEARRAASPSAPAASPEKLARQSQTVNQYNQQLHREVLLLMGR